MERANSTQIAREDIDQTGFELPPAPQIEPEAIGQGKLLTDDYNQHDATDGESVFWADGGIQASPDDGFVQADATESI